MTVAHMLKERGYKEMKSGNEIEFIKGLNRFYLDDYCDLLYIRYASSNLTIDFMSRINIHAGPKVIEKYIDAVARG